MFVAGAPSVATAGPLAIRRRLRRSRRHGAAVIVAIALGGAVVAHHAMPMEMHAMPVAAICLAFAIGGLSAAVASGEFGFVRRRFTRALAPMPAANAFGLPVGIPARASPLFLQICSIRR